MRKFFVSLTLAALPIVAAAAYAEETKPQVEFIRPLDYQTLNVATPVMARIMNGVPVKKMDFYLDGGVGSTLLHSDDTAPYAFTFDPANLKPGYHHIAGFATTESGLTGSNSISFIVGPSPDLPSYCQHTRFYVRNNMNKQILGGIWGTHGDMGSGGWSVEANQVDFVDLSTSHRSLSEGDYGVHVEVRPMDNFSAIATCEVVIPNLNTCPRVGINAFVEVDEGPSGSAVPTLRCYSAPQP